MVTVLIWAYLFGFVMVVRWQRRKDEVKVEVLLSDWGWSNSDTKLMQDNHWGNRDREKKNKNGTNLRNHHLESVYKTVGITT